MSLAEKLLTAEEYGRLDDGGAYTELVRGRIVEVNPPNYIHGFICARIVRLYGNYIDANDLGRICSNDTAVITQRDPDTVRGADVAFVSYSRLPKGPLPDMHPSVVPEVVFEVLSPSDRWAKVIQKCAEYLNAGALVVCIVDPKKQRVHVFRTDQEAEIVTADQALVLREVFGDFSVPVSEFFE